MKKVILAVIFFTISLSAQSKSESSYKLFGYLRAWHQTDFATNQGAFSIKMARIGVKGKVNSYASYKFLVDVSRAAKLSTDKEDVAGTSVVTGVKNYSDILLDAVATISPVKKFKFSLGQFKVPFSTDNLRGASAIDFINRPLLTKVAPSLRDIGLMFTYTDNFGLPVSVDAGLFNGSGQNKGETDNSQNYSFRTVVNITSSLSVAGNYYGGKLSNSDVNIFDFGADYKVGDLKLSAEYGQRSTSVADADVNANAYFIYAVYSIGTGSDLISSIDPAVRFENYDPNSDVDDNGITRTTIGAALQFAKATYAQLRFNYELYNYQDGRTNPDKFIIELQTRL